MPHNIIMVEYKFIFKDIYIIFINKVQLGVLITREYSPKQYNKYSKLSLWGWDTDQGWGHTLFESVGMPCSFVPPFQHLDACRRSFWSTPPPNFTKVSHFIQILLGPILNFKQCTGKLTHWSYVFLDRYVYSIMYNIFLHITKMAYCICHNHWQSEFSNNIFFIIHNHGQEWCSYCEIYHIQIRLDMVSVIWFRGIHHTYKELTSSHINPYIEAETKWPPFSRRQFQMHFLEWKYINLD